MWWLIEDVVALWRCGGFLEMWWLFGDVVAYWSCGGSIGDVMSIGNVVFTFGNFIVSG